jgi:hypothetical protein
MTPESVLEAMTKALAEKYTTSGYERNSRFHRTNEERLDQGMMKTFEASDGNLSIRAVTPREAAVAAMDVVGPILEMVWSLNELLKRSRAAMDDMAQDVDGGPSAEYHALSWELGEAIRQVDVEEPTDWDYVNRFSATPSEIHDILRRGLHPNVHLAYQQAIGKKIVDEAAEDILKAGRESFTQEQLLYSPEHAAMSEMVRRSANLIKRGGPYPEDVVSPEG